MSLKRAKWKTWEFDFILKKLDAKNLYKPPDSEDNGLTYEV
jgi:hypothetical protein